MRNPYGYEPPEQEPYDYLRLSVTHPVARFPHTCKICKLPIKAGEKHERRVFLEEGKFNCERIHYLANCPDRGF